MDDDYGLNPDIGSIKDLYDQGKVVTVYGVGYPSPSRSHFRSMDSWQNREPTKVGGRNGESRLIREHDLTRGYSGDTLPRSAMPSTGEALAAVIATREGGGHAAERYLRSPGPGGCRRGSLRKG